MQKQQGKSSQKKGSKSYTPEQIKEFELAGGVEGGMPAGDAISPGADAPEHRSKILRKAKDQ